MQCPSCKGKTSKRQGGIHCDTCGDLVQSDSGEWVVSDRALACATARSGPDHGEPDEEPAAAPKPDGETARRGGSGRTDPASQVPDGQDRSGVDEDDDLFVCVELS